MLLQMQLLRLCSLPGRVFHSSPPHNKSLKSLIPLMPRRRPSPVPRPFLGASIVALGMGEGISPLAVEKRPGYGAALARA